MFASIAKTFRYIINMLKYLDDSKDPFEAGDLVEVREEIEYVDFNPPVFKLPPELIGKIIKQIKDPKKIANVMLVNKTWYKEGCRRLHIDRDDIMEWLKLKRINKLGSFIRCQNLDRLDEYGRIIKKLKKIREKLNESHLIAHNNYYEALRNLPDTFDFWLKDLVQSIMVGGK
ncbi:7354_t:CDS:1 [Entrophospora sp. SA101]|nr:7354_t:CDS:1 [Entrophospora sp. SA101]